MLHRARPVETWRRRGQRSASPRPSWHRQISRAVTAVFARRRRAVPGTPSWPGDVRPCALIRIVRSPGPQVLAVGTAPPAPAGRAQPSPSRITRAFLHRHRPSSERATAPAGFQRLAVSVSRSPRIPHGDRRRHGQHPDALAALGAALQAHTGHHSPALSTGRVGVGHTGHRRSPRPGPPPRRRRCRISSLWVWPGSRRWTCMSISPGATASPEASSTWASAVLQRLPNGGDLPVFDQNIRYLLRFEHGVDQIAVFDQ